jgi:hypothetical protein
VAWSGLALKFISRQTCDEELPHLITNVETTPAAVPDDQVLASVHQALQQRDVLPEIHLVDAGYTDSEGLGSLRRDYGVTLLGPVAADPSWQAKAAEGFDKASFLIDWEREIVICPEGRAELFLVAQHRSKERSCRGRSCPVRSSGLCLLSGSLTVYTSQSCSRRAGVTATRAI